jgi:hypothetical protein
MLRLVLSGGKVNFLMAGSAAVVLPVSLSCPLPLSKVHHHPLLVCHFFVLAEMGVTRKKRKTTQTAKDSLHQ